ncbi:LysR family transcriptional regulator [Clostridium estertheticum]|uniref:LysR family transcriptional regulator n=1 Tax=Clostridium estertheticum TaxID=238834 RepID=UPI001C0E8C16|nr:LysR family transcriptional regulator [Clostridium estertheticum]MBU3201096.1 LysR family transcriptional regulator [Clostridium estertheticum]WAG66597.1 LysR family transcriptional regulator [Clostridium estertheticum]
MFEIYQLEQLLEFVKYGTLSKAAKELHLSQPALSRSMQKLENELHVILFERQKNKITLNQNGALAVEYAERVLNQAADMVERVRSFDRSQHTISVGSCAPAPLWSVTPLLSTLYPEMTISSDMKSSELLLQELKDSMYQFIILQETIDDSAIHCTKYGEEHLFLSLPPAHPLSGHKGVYFKDIDGQNLLLFSKIGFWNDLCLKKMPSSHFLVQDERFSFEEIVKNSVLPSFTSDLAIKRYGNVTNRVIVPILDPEATVSYYFMCLVSTKNKMEIVLHEIERHML